MSENERGPLYGWLADEHNLFHAVSAVDFKLTKENASMVAVGKDGELTLCGMPAEIMEWPGRGWAARVLPGLRGGIPSALPRGGTRGMT